MPATNVKEYITLASAYEDRRDAAIAGVAGDIQFYKDTIAKLQSNPGTFTPEDQALVDAMEARLKTSTEKLEALDAEVAPVPPVV